MISRTLQKSNIQYMFNTFFYSADVLFYKIYFIVVMIFFFFLRQASGASSGQERTCN